MSYEIGDTIDAAALVQPWVPYTPSLTNITLGNGTRSARYQLLGGSSCRVRAKFVMGSTSVVFGLMGFGYPPGVTPAGTLRNIGHCWMTDATAAPVFIGESFATSSIFCYGNPTTIRLTGTTATSPFTWAVNDELEVDITFECTVT